MASTINDTDDIRTEEISVFARLIGRSDSGQDPCWLIQSHGWAMQGQQMVSEGEDWFGTHWLPSTLYRGVCSNGQRSPFSLLQSLSTQFHLPCPPVVSFPSRYHLPACIHPFDWKVYVLLRWSSSIPAFLWRSPFHFFRIFYLPLPLELPRSSSRLGSLSPASQYQTLSSSRPGLPSGCLIQYVSLATLDPIFQLPHSDGLSQLPGHAWSEIYRIYVYSSNLLALFIQSSNLSVMFQVTPLSFLPFSISSLPLCL